MMRCECGEDMIAIGARGGPEGIFTTYKCKTCYREGEKKDVLEIAEGPIHIKWAEAKKFDCVKCNSDLGRIGTKMAGGYIKETYQCVNEKCGQLYEAAWRM
jgi:hypothetical protein